MPSRFRGTAEILQGKKDIVPLGINFSRGDFADPDLFEKTIAILEEFEIPSDLIEIEITESAYVDYEEQIIAFLTKCHASGIKVLMDDFGSGKSSFASLKNLDIDGLKLDYKFLGQSESSRKKRKIIESIVTLARSLQLPLIIEGVEKEEDAAYFKRLGVRYIQGFLFGKPMKADDFASMLNKRAEILSQKGHDDRLMLDELIDQKSNLHLLIDQLPVPTALYRYDEDGFRPMFLNRKAIDSVSRLGNYEAFLATDLLKMLPEDEKARMIEYLEETKEFYSLTSPRKFAIRRGLNLHNFHISLMLIKQEGTIRYYLVRASQRATDASLLSGKPNYTREEFHKSVAFGSRNYAIFSEKGRLVEMSPGAKELYPSLAIGMAASELFGEEVAKLGSSSRFYDIKSNRLTQVEFAPLLIDGINVTVASFSPLSDNELHVALTAKEGYGFFERALKSSGSIAVYYTEIDLDEDRYFQVRLSDQGFEEQVYRQGRYSDDYLPHFLQRVSADEREKMAEKMKLSALREGHLSRAPFEASYGIEGSERYFRIRVLFQFSHGHRYACFFSEDISDLRKKDFDPLTGLYTRRAGRLAMDRYIKDHPLSKMAFVIFDIDHFKKFNDTYGHPLGDKVLASLKRELEQLPTEYEYFTLFGGDEFTLLITERGKDFSVENVREALSKRLASIGHKVGLEQDLGVSSGVALIPEEGSSIHDVYASADNSLYQHKARKRGE